MKTSMPRHLWHILAALLCLTPMVLGAGLPLEASARMLDLSCVELLEDGGFESGTAWTINLSAAPATYVEMPTHSGGFAVRLGLVEEPNRETYSSLQQEVALPAGLHSITLSFHVYTLSGPGAGEDEQYLALIDPASATTITRPWRTLSDGRAWSEEVIDLTAYGGRSIVIYFNVYNDGGGSRSAMFLDDVALQACTVPTATPTATLTPTPTATLPPIATPTATATLGQPMPTPTPPPPPPGPCQVQCLPNGDFETHHYWQLGTAPIPPAIAQGKGMGGSRALRLGNDGQINQESYSSARQELTIPSWPRSVRLSFWTWTLSEGVDTDDHQELLLLSPGSQQVEASLWRVSQDDQRWLQQVVNLTPYRGRSLDVYFNVYNDGQHGRSAMYLDDVCLELCGATPPDQRPRPRPTARVRTATPTRRPRPPVRPRTPSATWRRPPSTRRPTPTRSQGQSIWATATLEPTTAAVPTEIPVTATAILPVTGATPTRRVALPTLPPLVTPTVDRGFLLPVTGFPALPAALAGWGPLEWGLFITAILIVLGTLIALIVVIVRRLLLPALAHRR
jgi:hypothetical protein